MRLGFVSAIVGFGILAGCSSTGNFSFDAGLNIKKNGSIEVLTGSIDPAGPNGQAFRMYGNQYGIPYKNGIAFTVSNLDLSCAGSTNTVEYRAFASGVNDRVTGIIPFECSDGRTGKIKMQMTMGRGAGAIGIGKMSDGSAVKLGFASSGQLEW
jgi:hypothetical protein|tara:strand:+ start:225 stop:686 length:462 start_codon:yes stop_codon:yes gene_type:complete